MVRAPFILHTENVDTTTGQAHGTRWFLAPFRQWRRRVADATRVVGWRTRTSFAYAEDSKNAQYLGIWLHHWNAPSEWRR